MHEKRIRNILLAIVAALLLFTLGVLFAPATQAIPQTQYKAVSGGSADGHAYNSNTVQQALDQQRAQGWVSIPDAHCVMAPCETFVVKTSLEPLLP
jgi:hypothetical protein